MSANSQLPDRQQDEISIQTLPSVQTTGKQTYLVIGSGSKDVNTPNVDDSSDIEYDPLEDMRMSTYETEHKKGIRRAWICLRCPEDSTSFIAQKFRVQTHILKEHLDQEQNSPFFCSLCKYACLSMKELEKHVKHFAPHKILVKDAVNQGLHTNDSSYFITNSNPFKFTDSDYRILSRDESIHHSKKNTRIIPLPIITDSVSTTALLHSCSTSSYFPTFGPPTSVVSPALTSDISALEPPTLDPVDVEAVISILGEQTSSTSVVNNQIHTNTTVSTTTIMDNLVVEVDFLKSPPSSPAVATPNLSSPVRNIIMHDRAESDSKPPKTVDILPLMLNRSETIDKDNFHPSEEWNMVPTSVKSSAKKSSSSSSSSSSSGKSEILNNILKAVTELQKVNENVVAKVDNLSTEVDTLKSQVTGLRSVTRQQNVTIEKLSKKSRTVSSKPHYHSNNHQSPFTYKSPLSNYKRRSVSPLTFQSNRPKKMKTSSPKKSVSKKCSRI